MDGWVFEVNLKPMEKIMQNMLKVTKHSQMFPTPLWLKQGDTPSGF